MVKKAQDPKDKAAKLRKSLAIEQEGIGSSIAQLEQDDKEHTRELARMFRYLRKLRRKLETECLDTKTTSTRNVYALCTVMSQQREVIADIRAITDLSGQVDTLDTSVLQPFTRSVGQQVLNSYYQLRKLTTETAGKGQVQFALEKIEEIIKDLTGSLQVQYEQSLNQTNKIFLGEARK